MSAVFWANGVSFNSDIYEHTALLTELAEKSDVVAEFGVRWGESTLALVKGVQFRLLSFDINPCDVRHVEEEALKRGVRFEFKQEDSRDVELPEVDMLFIDSEHTYSCLSDELRLHAKKVRKYIALHDVELFGWKGEHGGAGLLQAVCDFLQKNPAWYISTHRRNCNGLMVLERWI